MDFTGQRVILLGEASGSGLVTAQATAALGAEVLVASSCAEKVDVALSALPAAGGRVVDASDEPAIEALFGAVREFDHLVFTAGGRLLFDEINQLSATAAKETFDMHFRGAWIAAKHAHKHIRPGGSIVLSSGIAASRAQPGETVAGRTATL